MRRALVEVEPAAECVREGVGLAEDLLQHEVREPVLLYEGDIAVDGLDPVPQQAPARGDPCEAHVHDLPLAQVDHVSSVGDNRGHVARHQVLALPYAHHQRASQPGRDQGVGLEGGHDGDAVGTPHPGEGALHRVEEAPAGGHLEAHQMGDHLGVGVGREADALLLQVPLQLLVVLDYPVVHEGYVAREVQLGVSVALGGLAVRGPARMGYPGGAVAGFGGIHGFQLADATPAPSEDEAVGLLDGIARGVVSPVLEALQTRQEDLQGGAAADESHYSAHMRFTVLSKRSIRG